MGRVLAAPTKFDAKALKIIAASVPEGTNEIALVVHSQPRAAGAIPN